MKGGINFEEWKEIVKKNRRSLRSKSNIYRFEPYSLTYGAEQLPTNYAVDCTITYNVTGSDTSKWPTFVNKGQTLKLDLQIQQGHMINEIDINVPYTIENGILIIQNVSENLSITLDIGEADYTKASVGMYLYNDGTFGSERIEDKITAICVADATVFDDHKSRWFQIRPYAAMRNEYSSETTLTLGDILEGVPSIVEDHYNPFANWTANSIYGYENCKLLQQFDAEAFPSINWACQQFNGNGYVPSLKEFNMCDWTKVSDEDRGNFGDYGAGSDGFTSSLNADGTFATLNGWDFINTWSLGGGQDPTKHVADLYGQSTTLVFVALGAPLSVPKNNQIIYKAPQQLPVSTSGKNSAINVDFIGISNTGSGSPTQHANIVSHVFENGTGIITFDIDINYFAFFAIYLTDMTDIILPAGIRWIASRAFSGGSGHNTLLSITIYAELLDSLYDTGNSSCKVYVPADSVNRYKSKFTSDASKIYAIQE